MDLAKHSDDELRHIYTNGECPAFALALATLLQAAGVHCIIQAVVDEGDLWTDEDGDEYPTPFHVFVQVADLRCLDALGVRSAQEIIDAYVCDMTEYPLIEDFTPSDLAHHCGFEDQPFYPIDEDDLQLAKQAIEQLGIARLAMSATTV